MGDARDILSPTRLVVMDDGLRSIVVLPADDVLDGLREAAGLTGPGRVVIHYHPDGRVEVEGSAVELCQMDWDLDDAGPAPVACCWSTDADLVFSTDGGTPLYRVLPPGVHACDRCGDPIRDDPHTDPETGGDIHERCCPVCEEGP